MATGGLVTWTFYLKLRCQLTPADAVKDLHSFRVIFTQHADIEVVFLKVTPGFQHRVFLDAFHYRELIVTSCKDFLGFIGCHELKEANAVFRILGVSYQASTTYVYMRATTFLIGENNADFTCHFTVSIVIGMQQPNVVIVNS